MAKKGRTPLGEEEKQEIRSAAENLVAVQIAREVLESAPTQEMEEKEKREVERMRKILDCAARLLENPEPAEEAPETEAASGSWNAFLHAFLKFILYESENVRKRIQNVSDEMQEKAGAGRTD